MSEVTSVPTSKIKRGAITGVAAAKVGIKHFSHKTRYFLSKEINKKQSKEKHQEELSDLIFSVLCQLRGTALKFSQLLSMEAGIFTKSIRDKFRGACHGIVPIDRELVRQQIFKELGNSPAQLFRSFNSSAFAAASIGQVHRAIHDNGDLLAVKVQYPGIEIAIASDLKLVEKIIWLLSKSSHLLPEKKVVDLLLEEMTERLKEEIDYEIEAGHLRWFRKSIKLECVVIPRVIDELTAKRVITLEFIEGKNLTSG